jgi:hypothetical protein
VYKDCNYDGYAVSLPIGSYTLAQLNALGVLNDDVSSIKIPSGLEVVLYQDYNFTGTAYKFPASDFSCLVTVGLGDGTTVNLNDWTSSIVVRAAGSARKSSAVGTVEKVATADEDSKLQTALAVSPNPFVNEVVVKATSTAKDGSLYVSVYSLDGKTVLPLKRIVSGDKLSLSNLGAGMYLIRIFNGTTTETKKIVKY